MCLLFPLQSGPLSMEFVSKSICTKKKKKKGAVKTIMNNSSFQGKLFPPEGRGKMRKDKIKTLIYLFKKIVMIVKFKNFRRS